MLLLVAMFVTLFPAQAMTAYAEDDVHDHAIDNDSGTLVLESTPLSLEELQQSKEGEGTETPDDESPDEGPDLSWFHPEDFERKEDESDAEQVDGSDEVSSGLILDLYKSDMLEESSYEICELIDSNPFIAELHDNVDESARYSLTFDPSDFYGSYRWSGSGDKSLTELLVKESDRTEEKLAKEPAEEPAEEAVEPAEDAEADPAAEEPVEEEPKQGGQFWFQNFVLKQDDSDLAEYFLFIYQMDDEDACRYLIVSREDILSDEEVHALFAQYMMDGDEFVEHDDWAVDDIRALRDQFREDHEVVAAGVMDEIGYTVVAVDLEGPNAEPAVKDEEPADEGEKTGEEVEGETDLEADLPTDAISSALRRVQSQVLSLNNTRSSADVGKMPISFTKVSSNPTLTNANPTQYSLANAVYGIYSDAACTNELEIVSTDATGAATSANKYPVGVYYIKEIGPSNGFKLDTNVHQVEVKYSEEHGDPVFKVGNTTFTAAPGTNGSGEGYSWNCDADGNFTINFTQSTTFTFVSGWAQDEEVTVIGGGAGGTSARGSARWGGQGGNGGGGGATVVSETTLTQGTPINVVVGAGGAGGYPVNGDGNASWTNIQMASLTTVGLGEAGGNSSFGSIVANGGQPDAGAAGASGVGGGADGTGNNGGGGSSVSEFYETGVGNSYGGHSCFLCYVNKADSWSGGSPDPYPHPERTAAEKQNLWGGEGGPDGGGLGGTPVNDHYHSATGLGDFWLTPTFTNRWTTVDPLDDGYTACLGIGLDRDGGNGVDGTGGGGGGGAFASRHYTVGPPGSEGYPFWGSQGGSTGSATAMYFSGAGGKGGSGLVTLTAQVQELILSGNTEFPEEPDSQEAEDIHISFTKTSSNPTLTNAHPEVYSLSDAVYGIYSDSACTALLEQVTTDASGNATSTGKYGEGTYYVKEITPSMGFQLDPNVHTATIATVQSSSSSSDPFKFKIGNTEYTGTKGNSGSVSGGTWAVDNSGNFALNITSPGTNTFEVTSGKLSNGHVKVVGGGAGGDSGYGGDTFNNWSYTKEYGNTGWSEYGSWLNPPQTIVIQWYNEWTVTELPRTELDYIRLQVKFTTATWWTQPSGYVQNYTDRVTYNGTTVNIRGSRTPSNADDYTKEIKVPASWAGKTVTFVIGNATRNVVLDVAEKPLQGAGGNGGGGGMTGELDQNIQSNLKYAYNVGAGGAAGVPSSTDLAAEITQGLGGIGGDSYFGYSTQNNYPLVNGSGGAVSGGSSGADGVGAGVAGSDNNGGGGGSVDTLVPATVGTCFIDTAGDVSGGSGGSNGGGTGGTPENEHGHGPEDGTAGTNGTGGGGGGGAYASAVLSSASMTPSGYAGSGGAGGSGLVQITGNINSTKPELQLTFDANFSEVPEPLTSEPYKGRDLGDPLSLPIQFTKVSSNPAMTNPNPQHYSLEGAVYGIYSDAACTHELEIVTTNSSGVATSATSYEPGTYYIKELAPSKGFELDTSVHQVELQADTQHGNMVFSYKGNNYTVIPGRSGSGSGVSWKADAYGNFAITFTDSGAFKLVSGLFENANVTVVGGGAGGNSANGDIVDSYTKFGHGGEGGGGGATVTSAVTVTAGTSINVVVGKGGAGGVPTMTNASDNSLFPNYTPGATSEAGMAFRTTQGLGTAGGASSFGTIIASGGAVSGGASTPGTWDADGVAGTGNNGGSGGVCASWGENTSVNNGTLDYVCYRCGANLGTSFNRGLPGAGGPDGGGDGGAAHNDCPNCGASLRPLNGQNGIDGLGGGGGGGGFASRIYQTAGPRYPYYGNPNGTSGSATALHFAGRGGKGGDGIVYITGNSKALVLTGDTDFQEVPKLTSTPVNIPITFTKTSSNAALTSQYPDLYSLQGAVYGIYSNSACTNLLEQVTTDSSGNATSSNTYGQGTYYIKEISPSPGFLLDTSVHTATISQTSGNNNEPFKFKLGNTEYTAANGTSGSAPGIGSWSVASNGDFALNLNNAGTHDFEITSGNLGNGHVKAIGGGAGGDSGYGQLNSGWTYTGTINRYDHYNSGGVYYSQTYRGSYTITELPNTTRVGLIYLRVSWSSSYSKTPDYVNYNWEDYLSCNGSKVTIINSHQAEYYTSYTADVAVPVSWAGKNINVHVGGSNENVNVPFGASARPLLGHGGNGGGGGQSAEADLNLAKNVKYAVTVGAGGTGGAPSTTEYAGNITQGTGAPGAASVFGVKTQSVYPLISGAGGTVGSGGAGATSVGAGTAGSGNAGGGGGSVDTFTTGADGLCQIDSAGNVRGGAGGSNGGGLGGTPQNDHQTGHSCVDASLVGTGGNGTNGAGGGGGGGAYASYVLRVGRLAPAGYAYAGGNGGSGSVQITGNINNNTSQLHLTVNSAFSEVPDESLVPSNAHISIHKSSADPSVTNGNNCYSLQGAVYGIYSDSACHNLLESVSTNASGVATSTDTYAAGTYYIKEISASNGYELDSTVYSVVVPTGGHGNTTVTKNVTEQPGFDPIGIILRKNDEYAKKASATSGKISLAGAEYTLKFYGGQYATAAAAQASGSPMRSWVIKTNANGFAHPDDPSSKVSGDEWWYTGSGYVTFPYGTLVIYETKAPTGYLLNSTKYVVNFTESGASSEIIDTDNNPDQNTILAEQPIAGDVKVQKVDAEQTTVMGNGTFQGAEFTIYNNNGKTITLNGTDYANGAAIMKITTNSSGVAQTTNKALPYGVYYIKETKAPTGYQLNSTWRYDFTISTNGQVINAGNCGDNIIRGGLVVEKKDAETGKKTAQGDASFAGTVFEIKNASTNKVIVNGTSYNAGAVVMTITADANGKAQTGANVLPYGKYTVTEKSVVAGNGYGVNSTYSATVNVKSNGTRVAAADAVNTNNIHGGVQIQKIDANLQTTNPQGDAALSGAQFQIKNASANSVYVNGTEYAVGAVVLTATIPASGTYQSGKVLPKGTYTITETVAPTGYKINSSWSKTFTITTDQQMQTVDTSNANIQCADEVIRGAVSVQKLDSSTMQNTGPGGIKMAGAELTIINRSSHAVVYNGVTVQPYVGNFNRSSTSTAGIVAVITTNNNGVASTPASSLPYGTYEIFETKPAPNYKLNTDWHKTFSIRTDGQLVDLSGSDALLQELAVSGIEISKTVTGNMASRDKAFTFTITLKDASNQAIRGTFPYTKGSETGNLTTNASGSANFTLKHGETIVINNLTIGTKYTVTEANYAAEGYVTSSSNATGTIPGGANANVSFTNKRNASVPTGIDDQASAPPYLMVALAATLAGAVGIASAMKRKRRKEG